MGSALISLYFCRPLRLAFLLTARRNKTKGGLNQAKLHLTAITCLSFTSSLVRYRPKSSDISWLLTAFKKWAQSDSKLWYEKGNIDLELKWQEILFGWHLNLLTVESQFPIVYFPLWGWEFTDKGINNHNHKLLIRWRWRWWRLNCINLYQSTRSQAETTINWRPQIRTSYNK